MDFLASTLPEEISWFRPSYINNQEYKILCFCIHLEPCVRHQIFFCRVRVWDTVAFLESTATFVGHTDLVHSVCWAEIGGSSQILFSASQVSKTLFELPRASQSAIRCKACQLHLEEPSWLEIGKLSLTCSLAYQHYHSSALHYPQRNVYWQKSFAKHSCPLQCT